MLSGIRPDWLEEPLRYLRMGDTMRGGYGLHPAPPSLSLPHMRKKNSFEGELQLGTSRHDAPALQFRCVTIPTCRFPLKQNKIQCYGNGAKIPPPHRPFSNDDVSSIYDTEY
jgi:hypothetical protein